VYKLTVFSDYRGLPQVLLFLFLLTGCGKSAGQKTQAPAKVHVVATVYPLADLARQVGGDAVDCDWIAEQGQSLDTLDPTPEVIEKIRSADVVISGGIGEDWATAGFDDPMRAKAILRLDLLPSAKADAGCRQLWLDPRIAKECAHELAERLIVRRPGKGGAMRANADKFASEIDGILADFSSRNPDIQSLKVLVLSADYSALLRSLGITEIRPIDASAMRLSDDDLRTLSAAIRTRKPAALLIDVGVPAGVQQDLSQRLGIRVLPLDSLGSSSTSGRNTYQSILRYDLSQLSSLMK